MSAESVSNLKFELGHLLSIDIVGYSKLLIAETIGCRGSVLECASALALLVVRVRGVANPKAAEHRRTPKRKRHTTLTAPCAASQRRSG